MRAVTADDAGAPRTVLRGTLRDGLRVVIRSLVAADRDDVEHGFGELSERTKNLRFMTGKDHLSQRTLDSLVDQVDQVDHVAVAMWWERTTQADVLLGEGRFIRLTDDPDCADVAVTVADERTGRAAARCSCSRSPCAPARRGSTGSPRRCRRTTSPRTD